jgi:hypothetical protein
MDCEALKVAEHFADTGQGCDKPNSDAFYHWGGLLGMIAFIEEGYREGPEKPIKTGGTTHPCEGWA